MARRVAVFLASRSHGPPRAHPWRPGYRRAPQSHAAHSDRSHRGAAAGGARGGRRRSLEECAPQPPGCRNPFPCASGAAAHSSPRRRLRPPRPAQPDGVLGRQQRGPSPDERWEERWGLERRRRLPPPRHCRICLSRRHGLGPAAAHERDDAAAPAVAVSAAPAAAHTRGGPQQPWGRRPRRVDPGAAAPPGYQDVCRSSEAIPAVAFRGPACDSADTTVPGKQRGRGGSSEPRCVALLLCTWCRCSRRRREGRGRCCEQRLWRTRAGACT